MTEIASSALAGQMTMLDTSGAIAALSSHLGYQVGRPTLSAWIKQGFLPGVPMAGGRAVFIPRAAVPLFRKPGAGAYHRRENLARGVGIALATVGEARVPRTGSVHGITGAKCPRCGSPFVIAGGKISAKQAVAGHEHDCCCCNLDCLYIGPDFLSAADPRVTVVGDKVVMRAK